MEAGAEVVEEIVAEALGERPTRLEHIPTIENTTVFRVTLPSTTAYYKTEHEGHSLAALAWAYERAAEVGVPVPDVLHLGDDFIIISAVTGRDLTAQPTTTQLEACGEALRSLHSIELEGYGDIHAGRGTKQTNAEYVPMHPKWSIPYIVEHALLSLETLRLAEDILDRHTEFVDYTERGRLIHGDFGLDHVFAEGDTITGIIDFEPESTDPMVDLARFAYHYPGEIAAVLAGYGETPDDVEIRFALYGLLRGLGSLRWEHERGFDSYVLKAQDEIERRTKELRPLLH